MFPKINPRQMQKMMQKMGVKQEEIEASEVIIKCHDKELIIRNPQVSKIEVAGQESLQISGEIEEKELESYTEEDVKTVMTQAKVSEETAKSALEKENGNIAAAIIKLKSNKT